MMGAMAAALNGVHFALLGGASVLVPRSQRREWRREWRAELWHARQMRRPGGVLCVMGEQEIAAFCLGAFQDALCLRGERTEEKAPRRNSAAQCLLRLAAITAAGVLMAELTPGVRRAANVGRYEISSDLMLIADASSGDGKEPISARRYRGWKASQQRYFETFAFYSLDREPAPSSGEPAWRLAYASENLFQVLGLPLRFAAEDGSGSAGAYAQVVLSCDAVEREFGGSAPLAGLPIRVGGQMAVFAGMLPCGAWRLPGRVDAWLLEPDEALGKAARGFLVARLSAFGKEETEGRGVQITEGDPEEPAGIFWGEPIETRARGPWDLYRFAALLALLALPAVTSVSMGDYSFSTHRPSWRRRLVRWAFLSAKIGMVLVCGYYLPLDLAYWRSAAYAYYAPQYLQLAATFLLCLMGMRWALADQKQRCPVCLSKVTNPAQVGQASRTFLAWNGTEMICLGGHTLLHVPGLPTSWFSTQRWLYLDASWEFLFSGVGEG